MKKINLIYNDKGFLAEPFEHDTVYVAQQEKNAISFTANFPAFLQGTVRGYLQYPGGGDIIECGEITLNHNYATLTLGAEYLAYNYLKIGFEVVTIEKAIRFEPVIISVDSFVNPTGIGAGKNGYTVTVGVGGTTVLEPEETPWVKNVGTSKDAVFRFGIPRAVTLAELMTAYDPELELIVNTLAELEAGLSAKYSHAAGVTIGDHVITVGSESSHKVKISAGNEDEDVFIEVKAGDIIAHDPNGGKKHSLLAKLDTSDFEAFLNGAFDEMLVAVSNMRTFEDIDADELDGQVAGAYRVIDWNTGMQSAAIYYVLCVQPQASSFIGVVQYKFEYTCGLSWRVSTGNAGNGRLVWTEWESLGSGGGAFITAGTSKAGGKGFKVLAMSKANEDGTGTYTLSSVTGLEVGMTYSVKLVHGRYNQGKITAVSGNNVTVDNYDPDNPIETAADDPANFNIENYFMIVGRPDLGDIEVGYNAGAFGENCISQDRASFAMGRDNKAVGPYSLVGGRNNIGCYGTLASGRNNLAKGTCAAVWGQDSQALGGYSSAGGFGVVAQGQHQHVQGKFNLIDSRNEFAHIVGNGTGANKRSNAYTLDWGGNAVFAGEITANGVNLNKSLGAVETALDKGLSVIQNSAGTWVCEEFIAGVSAGFSLKLHYMLPVDGYALFVKGEDVSGILSLEESFTTAPSIFDTNMVDVVLYQGEKKFAVLSAQKTKKINTAICGILLMEDEKDEQ